ncbi:MAG: PaaI family thioesterase, partial [Caldilineae bacterium]
ALHTDLQPGETTATIEIKISYFRPVTAGTLVCETRIVHRGRRVATLEADVHNDGRLVARASGTFYIFTKEQNRRGS